MLSYMDVTMSKMAGVVDPIWSKAILIWNYRTECLSRVGASAK